jgi:hypothetical protein
MNKQIDYDYMIAKRDFDDSKINVPIKEQLKTVKYRDNLSQKMETKKTISQKEKIIQNQSKTYSQESKNKEHEGIFRNF